VVQLSHAVGRVRAQVIVHSTKVEAVHIQIGDELPNILGTLLRLFIFLDVPIPRVCELFIGHLIAGGVLMRANDPLVDEALPAWLVLSQHAITGVLVRIQPLLAR
jgi:hypothetical protein